jgi:hypothetical protein
MKFKQLNIRRMEYGQYRGQITAELSIEGKDIESTITIPEPASIQIMKACAEVVADAGATQAASFRAEFLAAVSDPKTP